MIKLITIRIEQMIKLIGWIAIIWLGLYTGIIQAVLAMLGAVLIWAGSMLSAL